MASTLLQGVEQYINDALGTVTSGGTTAPAAGTQETWTVSPTNAFPVASSSAAPPTGFYVCDQLTAAETEKMLVTVAPGGTGAGQSWTVVRGADGSTPVVHAANWTAVQVEPGASDRALQQSLGAALNVYTQFGADPTGTNASDSALAAAFSALGTGNGVLYVPAVPGTISTYKLTSGWTLNLADAQQVIIYCDPGVTFSYTGSGDCIRMLSAATSKFARGSGIVGNPTIDGTSAGAGASGLHFGDIREGRIYVTVQNFSGTGSIGVHIDNTIAWTERLQGLISVSNNTQNVVFDESGATTSTGSHARTNLDIIISNGAVTNQGVVLQNGAFFYHGRISIRGNFTSGVSGTPGAVLTVTGTGPAGHPNAGQASNIQGCQIDIGVEAPTGTVVPQTIKLGAAANTITQCYGSLSFLGAATWTTSNIGTSNTFQFTGPQPIGDPTLQSMTYQGNWSLGAIATGATIPSTMAGQFIVNPAAAVTGIIIAQGLNDGQNLTITNVSAFPVTFAASGTSNVIGGTSVTVPPHSTRTFTYRAAVTSWYPHISDTSNTSGSAAVLTPSFANGTAAQLSDTTRDYMVYLAITTSGTATTVAIGPTSTPANTILPSSSVTAGQLISFRLPAGWWVKWAGTTTAIATQTAIAC